MKVFSFKRIFFILVLCAVLPAVFINEACGDVRYYVTQDGAGSKDGTSWENAANNLKGLMDSIEGEAEIWVAMGKYSPGVESDDTFALKKGIKIYGGFTGKENALDRRNIEGNATLLDGGKILRCSAVVTAHSGALSSDTCLDGFTITGGLNITTNGGGLYSQVGSGPLITKCVFSDNIAILNGGGMYNFYSTPFITDCTFYNNTSFYENGGAVCNFYASPAIGNCTFIKNKADLYGGGMFNYGAIVEVTDCTFIENRSRQRGAGMSNLDSTVVVANCKFSGNHGEEYGGGMFNEDAVTEVRDSAFWNNIASPGNGGGMANVKSSVVVEGCRFLMNSSDYYGGGIINENSQQVKISGCAFFENKAIRFNGGGIANWSSSPIINGCRFYENTAIQGGGIFNNYSSSTMEDNIFSGNKAKTGNDIEEKK